MPVHGHRVNGLRIAQARMRLKDAQGRSLTQAAFAERVGIHWVTQSRIENGKARVSLDLLEKIAREIGESRDSLLADEEDEEAAPPMDDHLRTLAALAVALAPFHPDAVRT